MTMDVSRLGIVVKSEGIDEAKKGLDALGASAVRTEKKTQALTASLNKLLSVNVGGTAAAWASAMSGLQTTLQQMNAVLQANARQLTAFGGALQGVANQTQQATNAASRYSGESHVLMNTLKALTTVASVYAGINFVKSTVQAADAYQQLDARLKNVTGSQKNANLAMQDLYDISQRVRTPMKDTSTIMVRLFSSMGQMGKTGEDVAQVTEAVATGMKLWGATGAETASSMLQLSQAFNKGKLDGAEFNSIAENGKPLLEAIAKEMKVATGDLFTLRSQGKITGEVMVSAFQKMLPTWREQMEGMPITFEDAVQRIKNKWDYTIGRMGQDTGFNRSLSEALKVVEDLVPVVAKGLVDAFIAVTGWVKENKGALGQIWDQVTGLLGDVWNIGKMLLGWVGAIIGAGKETSVVGAIIFGIRVGIAGIVDLVKLVAYYAGGTLLAGFYAVAKVVQLVVSGVSLIIGGFERLYRLGAAAASALGMDSLAEKLGSAGDGIKSLNQMVLGLNDSIENAFDKGANGLEDFISDVKNGKGALQTLLEGGGSAMPEEQKRWKGPYDTLPGGKIKHAGEEDTKAVNKHAKAVEELNAKLKEQLEITARLNTYGLAYDKLGPGAKERIKLEEHLTNLQKSGASAKEIARTQELLGLARLVELQEVINERRLEGLRAEKQMIESQKTRTQSAIEEAAALQAKVDAYGKPKGTEATYDVEALKEARALMEATSDSSRNPEMEAYLAMLNQEIEAREKIAALKLTLGSFENEAEFDKLMDPKKAEKFGDALAQGFGKAGAGLGKLMNLMQSYETRQARVARAWELVQKQTDPIKRAKQADQAAEMEARSRIDAYGDMAGAAKDFFKEGTAGYKAMEGAEKAFRLFQMAMQLKSFMQEMGFITATTTAAVTSDTIQATSATTGAATEVAAKMAVGQANAVAGVANQANGDPYSAFARMAVMAAMMAALGFAVGGGGGGGANLSEDRQARQGTGTVFGDSKAKSESIGNAIELLAENSDIALRHSSGMLYSLQNIEASLTGVTNAILRGNRGSYTGSGFNGGFDPLIQSSGQNAMIGALLGGPLGALTGAFGSVLSKVLGFGTKTKLLDAGITFDAQSVADILSTGFDGKTYQDVEKKKDAFGWTYSRKRSRSTQDLDVAVEEEFTNIIDGMVDTIVEAGQVLGFTEEELLARLEAAEIDIGDISLKGLSAEEIQAELEAVFSGIGDSLVEVAVGDAINEFQQAGEGLLETIVRVASGIEQAEYELEKLGLTAIDFTDIINTNGDVGAEIVRQSIMQVEEGTGIGEIIETLQGSASDIASTYAQLLGVRESLQALGIADDVTRELIRAAGGLEAMQDALESYTENFFSDAERNAMHMDSLTAEFDRLGLTMPTTREGFRQLVDELSASGPEGQELAMQLLLLSDSFAQLLDTSEELVENARGDLLDAYNREAEALMDVKSKFEEFSKSLRDFKDGLIMGDLSPASAMEKYQTAKARYEDVLARAMAGDESALAEFESVAQEFLNLSRDVYASGDQYLEDFNNVLDGTTVLEQDTAGRASLAEQQLDALNQQVEGLIDINESVMSVEEAIRALQEAMNSGLTPEDPTMGIGQPPAPNSDEEAPEYRAYSMDYSSYGSGSSVALVEEIRALREEVATLRAEQQTQTAQLIATNYDAQEQNARAVVEGQKDAASTSSYTERAKVSLA